MSPSDGAGMEAGTRGGVSGDGPSSSARSTERCRHGKFSLVYQDDTFRNGYDKAARRKST